MYDFYIEKRKESNKNRFLHHHYPNRNAANAIFRAFLVDSDCTYHKACTSFAF